MPETILLSIEDKKAISTAKTILKQGGVIVLPTDTLYGLACDPMNVLALRKIYEIKGRSTSKAIPVLIGDIEQLHKIVKLVDERTLKLLNNFWPGALTVVLEKQAKLPLELTPYPGVAVRMPDHSFTLSLLRKTGPLAVTSANHSGDENARSAEDVYRSLGGQVDLILDAGITHEKEGSTIVDLVSDELKLLRKGPISFDEILSVLEE